MGHRNGSGELKVSPRFGLEPHVSPSSPQSQGGQRARERQAKAVAAHIARQRDSTSVMAHTRRPNPLTTSSNKVTQECGSNCVNLSATVGVSLDDSVNFSAIFGEVSCLSDTDSDLDACSCAESTSGKVANLCERADSLMRDLVAIVGPPTPPFTPLARIGAQGVALQSGEGPPSLGEATQSDPLGADDQRTTASQSNAEPPTADATTQRREFSDLQFRVSRLELQVSQITDSKTDEQVAELKKQLDLAKAELLATREEARETRIQVDMLAMRASLLEASSGGYPIHTHLPALDNSDVSTHCNESGRSVRRLSSVSSDGSQVLRQLPSARSYCVSRSPAQLPRARSIESVGRGNLYPFARGEALRAHRNTHKSGAGETLAPKRRSAPRVGDIRMCTVEQLMQRVQQRPFCLQKAAEGAVCSRVARSGQER